MQRGFTLLEVMLATVILGLGLTGIIVSMTQAQKTMLGSVGLETAQEVMDLGEMAYPLADVTDPEAGNGEGLEIHETKATELWDEITELRMSKAQEEKFHGYTWEREWVNKSMSDDDLKRLGGIHIVRITVRWGDRYRGHGERESYIALWRKPE